MDVSEEILRNHLIYGASDNTNPAYLSANRSLNYARGASIHSPEKFNVSLIPYTIKYQDTVGLFGAENYFEKVTVKLDRRFAAKCFEEPFWECAVIRDIDDTDANYPFKAEINYELDLETVNDYEPAEINNRLIPKRSAYVSVELNNLKTGNIYIDDWLDIRLYTAGREEHPYNKMYVRENDFFYVGFHARNTRRLPYNVTCVIGNEYVSEAELTEDDRRYIMRRLQANYSELSDSASAESSIDESSGVERVGRSPGEYVMRLIK